MHAMFELTFDNIFEIKKGKEKGKERWVCFSFKSF